MTQQTWRPIAWLAFLTAAALTTSAIPTPLYGRYQAEWHFTALTLAEIYAVYAVGVLAALVGVGSLSDVVGRRPVLATGSIGIATSVIIFTLADGVAWLFVARAVQGIATGLLLGAISAALLEQHPRRDPVHTGLVSGIAGTMGIGVGAILSCTLVEYAPYTKVLPYVVVVGTVLAGYGVGGTFMGALRMVVSQLEPHHRASVIRPSSWWPTSRSQSRLSAPGWP